MKSSVRKFRVFLFLAAPLSFFLRAGAAAGEKASAPVYAILWFDTEDYILPASDDAAKRLAELLAGRGVRATFKVVGEKARVLERRGRSDVIAALKKHDLGYHSNLHSVHPAPAEYLADCGLLDGMAEFIRREGPGAADVRRIFGVPTLSCYGQPGSSWGAQAIAALPQIGAAPAGVPCYVDEGSHVGLRGQPFWFAGALVVYDMGANVTRMDLHDHKAVEPAKKEVSEIATRLRGRGGGLISIYYHPCEWVHREFWDGVNFRRGANPPREEWKLPPQRSAEETEGAFQRFGEYIDHIRSIPGLRFVTAGDLPALYPDAARATGASREELSAMAERIASPSSPGAGFLEIGEKAFSAADQFELLTVAVAELASGVEPRFPLAAKGLLGPDGPPPAERAPEYRLSWPAFRSALLDAKDYLAANRRVPARVFAGAAALAPADFLAALAGAYQHHRRKGKLPVEEGVPFRGGLALLPAGHIAEDTPQLFGGWIIHPEGFRAPKILEVARLQAWTLKPAKLAAKK